MEPRHLPQELEGGERERRRKMLTPLTPDLQPNEEENRQLIVIFLVYLHLHCRQIFSFFQYVSMCKTIVSYLPQNRSRVCCYSTHAQKQNTHWRRARRQHIKRLRSYFIFAAQCVQLAKAPYCRLIITIAAEQWQVSTPCSYTCGFVRT